MEIPHTVEPRKDTGLFNAKVGIWLFLASEVMLFGALFSSYILLRVGAAPGEWPHGLLNVWLGMINTIVLICSSITVVMAWASLKMRNFGRFKLYQAITLLCAFVFVCIKSVEYHDKFTHYEVRLDLKADSVIKVKDEEGKESELKVGSVLHKSAEGGDVKCTAILWTRQKPRRSSRPGRNGRSRRRRSRSRSPTSRCGRKEARH
jgi:hypothetical protein